MTQASEAIFPWDAAEDLTDDQFRRDFIQSIEAIDPIQVGTSFAVVAYSTLVDVIATNSGIDRKRLFDIFHRQAELTDDERTRLEAVLLEPVKAPEGP